MTEKNINQLPGVCWWMRMRTKHHFRSGVIFLIIVIMMAVLFGMALKDISGFSEMVPLIILFGFFLFYTGYQFVLWKRSKQWNITNYWYGTVVDTYLIRRTKRRSRSYRIVADVEGKTMEGVCLLRTYNRAKIGDRVLLFTLEGDKVFCVHPDESR